MYSPYTDEIFDLAPSRRRPPQARRRCRWRFLTTCPSANEAQHGCGGVTVDSVPTPKHNNTRQLTAASPARRLAGSSHFRLGPSDTASRSARLHVPPPAPFQGRLLSNFVCHFGKACTWPKISVRQTPRRFGASAYRRTRTGSDPGSRRRH